MDGPTINTLFFQLLADKHLKNIITHTREYKYYQPSLSLAVRSNQRLVHEARDNRVVSVDQALPLLYDLKNKIIYTYRVGFEALP